MKNSHVPRTVTLRLSVVIGLVLLIVGGGVFGYGVHVNATSCPVGENSVHSLSLESGASGDSQITNVSTLPHDQQGVFLLALDSGRFTTTTNQLFEPIHDLPAVRYDGTVYQPSVSVGDCFGSGGGQAWYGGIALAGLGALTLLGAGIQTLLRKTILMED